MDGLASGLLGVGSVKYVKVIHSEALQGRPYIGNRHPASGLRIAVPQSPSLTAVYCAAVMHELYTLQSSRTLWNEPPKAADPAVPSPPLSTTVGNKGTHLIVFST